MTDREPASARAPGDDADAWFAPWRFGMLLAALIMLTFPGIIFGQETFFYRDFGVFGYPLAQFQRDAFWRGELPLWNPLNSCGLPFLAQWNTLCLYPPALLYLLFPLSWALGVFNLAHLFLAGMGMYFLARRWTGNALAASVAGTIFAFNGLTWHSLMWPNDIAGLGWMPWVVLAAERAWNEGGRRIVPAALAGAMQMLAGAPEIILLTWALTGILWLAQFFRECNSRKRMALSMAAVVALVAGSSAAQLLPFLDLLKHSQRDTGYGAGKDWAMPFSGLANFFAPLFHCYPVSHGVFMQYDQYWTASYYVGVGTMILAAAAVWRARDWRLRLLAVLAVAAVWMALGKPAYLYSIVNAVLPVLGFMRYPIKLVVLAVFLLPLLAAYGVERHRAESAASPEREITLVVLIFATWLLLAALAFFEWKFPWVSDDWRETCWNILRRAIFVMLIPCSLIGFKRLIRAVPPSSPSLARKERERDGGRVGLSRITSAQVQAISSSSPPPSPPLHGGEGVGPLTRGQFQDSPGSKHEAGFASQLSLGLALLLLLWLDVATHAPNLSPAVKRSVYEPGLIRAELKLGAAEPGEARFMETTSAMTKLHFMSITNIERDFLCRRLALFDNCNLLDGLPKIDGFYSLDLPDSARVIGLMFTADERNLGMQGMKDFLGVGHINPPGTNDELALEWIARDTALPLATAGQKPVFANLTNSLGAIFQTNFNPRETVYLPPEAASQITANRADAKILSQQISAQQLAVTIETPAPAMMVVAQSYYHSWHGWVDGRRVKLWEANGGFQAVEVPAGRHEVKLAYQDRAFQLGAVISLGALVALGVLWFKHRRATA